MMRTLAHLVICCALAAASASCVPIGVKSTTLPYAASAPAVTER